MRVQPNPVQMTPGESMDIAITLTNNSQEVERYEITVADMSPAWFKLEPADMLLYPESPGNEGTVTLRITLPADASPGSYLPSIQVTSNLQPGIAASTPINLGINPAKLAPPDIKLEPEVLRTNVGTARYRVNLKNNQDQPLSLRLVVEQEQPNVQSNLVPPVVRLAPSAPGFTMLEIQPQRRNWIRADKTYKFKLTADDVPVEVIGTLRQSAALPWVRAIITNAGLAVLLILLPLIFAGLLIAFVLWPRPVTTTTSGPSVFTGPASCAQNTSNVTVSLTMRGDKSEIVINRGDTAAPLRIAGNDATRLPGVFASLISVSPDGRYVAYVTARNQLMDDTVLNVYDIQTNNQRSVDRITSGFWPSRPIFNADGSKLVYTKKLGNQLELFGLNTTAAQPAPRQLTKQPNFLTPDLYYGDNAGGPLCFGTDGNQVIVANLNSPTQTQVDFNTGASSQPFTNQRSQTALEPVTNIRQPVPAPLNQGECFVPTFSMNALEWRDQQMKPRNDKIGEAGCPLTAAAMVMNYYKVDTDPNVLNTCLDTKSNPFDWEVTAQTCSNGQVQGGRRNDFTWDSLNAVLQQGRPAIVGLLGGQTGVHFVVVTGGFDNIAATYRVNDPFDGSNYKSLGTFLDQGYQLRWLVEYTINGTLACRDRSAKPTEQFSYGFRLTNALDGLMTQSGVVLGFTPEGTSPATPKVYFVPKATADDPTTGTTTPAVAPINGKAVENGEAFSDEGFYRLVFEGNTGAELNRTTLHFVIDKSPPVLIPDGAAATTLDQPDKDGFQVATKAPILIGVKATDNVSNIATIQYRIAPGTRTTADGSGSVKGLGVSNQVQATDWLLFNNDATTKPLAFLTAGDFEVYFRAIDGAGNITPDGPPLFKFAVSQAVADAAKANGATAGGANPGTSPGTGVGPGAGGTAGAGNGTGTPGAGTGEAPVVPIGSLKLAPETITFNSNLDTFNLQLNNTSGTPLTWNFQQPLPPQAQQYLNVGSLQQGGTVPPNGNLGVPINLQKFNTTGNPISFPLNILYNNGTNSVVLTIIIDPQPAPTVTFISPTPGPLSGKQINVALNVVAPGKAKPAQAKLKATFAAAAGAQPQPQAIGVATPSSNWTVSWDISTIPPQQNMSIGGDICWTNDDTQCQTIQGGVFGLSIGTPQVRVELVPNSPNLVVFNEIQATVVSGVIDHITYTFTYQDTSGAVQSGSFRATASNLRVQWNTSNIPPQQGTISLAAKVCWGPTDDDANCTLPVNQFPAPLTIQAPVITVTSGLVTAEIPISLTLAGQVSQLNRTSGSGVFVTVQNVKTGPTDPVTTLRIPATFSLTSGGQGTWSITNYDTSKWPAPQTLTIIPKICWDAAGPDTAANCSPVQTPINGVISPLTAAMGTPADFSQAIPLNITTSPPGRATSVVLTIGYQKFGATAVTTSTVNPALVVTSNAALYEFDSVLLGIKPGSKISFTIQPCGPGGCGTAVAINPTALIPVTSIDTATLTPTPADLAARSLIPSEPFSFNLTGRNATSILITSTYLVNGVTTNSSLQALPAPIIAQNPYTFNWDTTSIPPQTGIKLRYAFCWTGSLDTGCTAATDFYPSTTLFITAPSVTNYYLGSSSIPYNNTNAMLVPVDGNKYTSAGLKVINFPVTIDTANNAKLISWTLTITNTNTNTAVFNTSAQTAASINTASKFPLTVSITGIPQLSGQVSDYIATLVFAPGWQDPNTANKVFFNAAQSNTKNVLSIKLVDTNASLVNSLTAAGSSNVIAPLSVAPPTNQTIMVSNTSTIKGNFGTANAVKRMIFSVSYNNGGFVPLKISASNSQNVTATLTANTWNLDWDHKVMAPLADTSAKLQNISLAWQLCSADDDSTCIPSSSSGDILLNLGTVKLTLGAISLGAINSPNTPTPNPNLPLSFFQTQLDFSFASSNAAFVRFRVYPQQSPFLTSSVRMANQVTSSAGVTKTVDVMWTDNALPATPDWTTTANIACNSGNLITTCRLAPLIKELALVPGSDPSTTQVVMGVQYCLNAAVIPESCSDWQGSDGTGFGGLKSKVTGTLPVIMVWRPFDVVAPPTTTPANNNPYLDYLQSALNTPTARNIGVSIIPMFSTVNAALAVAPSVSFKYETRTAGSAFSNPSLDVICNAPISYNSANYTAVCNWNLPSLPVDGVATTTGLVRISAQVLIGGGLNFNQFSYLATHGRQT